MSSEDRDLGHAAKALSASYEYAKYIEDLSPEEKRRLLMKQIKDDLDVFGEKFLNIVFANPKYNLSEVEKQELRDYIAQKSA